MPNLTYGEPSPAPMSYEDYLDKYMQQMGVAAGNAAGGAVTAPSAPSGGGGVGLGGGLPIALGAKLGASWAGGSAPSAASFLNSGAAPLAQHQGALLSGSQAAATPATTTLGAAVPYLGAAGAGLGAYGVYDAIQNDNAGQGALSGAGMGLGLAAAAPLVGLGPVGWGAMGLMALGGAGLGGGLTSLFGHKSIAERQRERWGDLTKKEGSPLVQDFAKNYLAYLDSDVEHPGAKEDFNQKMKEGRATYEDVWGAPDLLKEIGDSWLAAPVEKRIAASNEMLKQGIFKHSQGDLRVTDMDLAKSIFANASAAPVTGPVTQALKGAVPVVTLPPRSKTLSPGISLDGKRIKY